MTLMDVPMGNILRFGRTYRYYHGQMLLALKHVRVVGLDLEEREMDIVKEEFRICSGRTEGPRAEFL